MRKCAVVCRVVGVAVAVSKQWFRSISYGEAGWYKRTGYQRGCCSYSYSYVCVGLVYLCRIVYCTMKGFCTRPNLNLMLMPILLLSSAL